MEVQKFVRPRMSTMLVVGSRIGRIGEEHIAAQVLIGIPESSAGIHPDRPRSARLASSRQDRAWIWSSRPSTSCIQSVMKSASQAEAGPWKFSGKRRTTSVSTYIQIR